MRQILPPPKHSPQRRNPRKGAANGNANALIRRTTDARGSGAPSNDAQEALGAVRDVIPIHQEDHHDASTADVLIWMVEAGARHNYALLGKRLSAAGDLYRDEATGYGLVLVRPDGKTSHIGKGNQLAPLIVDRVRMRVEKEGKVVSELPAASHLNGMLQSEAFLGQFSPVDEITRTFFLTENCAPLRPGYNDFGPGNRVLFLGDVRPTIQSTDTIRRFLDAMPFASEADATDNISIQHCDLRDLVIEPEFVALILTDVLWNDELFDDWRALGEKAMTWLKPEGLLATYIGQRNMVALAQALTDTGLHYQ